MAKKTLNDCMEVEQRSGMIVGLPKVRYICPCGHVTLWRRSQYKARLAFRDHSNSCDTALYLFFPQD